MTPKCTNMNKKLSKKAGFSIVEICMACVILLILLIPIFTLMSKGTSGTVHNKNEFCAKQLAANIIAYCNLIPFNSPEISEGEDILDKLKLNSEENELINLNENKIINIADVDKSFLKLIKVKKVSIKDIEFAELPNRYKYITVRIEWLESGKTQNNFIEMSGMIKEI